MRASGFLVPANTVTSHSASGLLHRLRDGCDNGSPATCVHDSDTIMAIFCILLTLVVCAFIAVLRFRDAGEEKVTPLCPKMVVTGPSITFKFAMDPQAEKVEVFNYDNPEEVIAKVCMDWPDPTRDCASGITSTGRLQNGSGMTLATVVARNTAVSGQALALCRSGCEIFGFVEPDTPMRYHVKHRTGVHLLTLVGDFSKGRIDGVNPAGTVVFSAKDEEGFCVGTVSQHVDAGLVICCVLAAHIHRFLQSTRWPLSPPPMTIPPMRTQAVMPPPPTATKEPDAAREPAAANEGVLLADPAEAASARFTEPAASEAFSALDEGDTPYGPN